MYRGVWRMRSPAGWNGRRLKETGVVRADCWQGIPSRKDVGERGDGGV